MYTEAISDKEIDVDNYPIPVGQSLYINNLSVHSLKALLNPRECEYTIRVDAREFFISSSEEGPLYAEVKREDLLDSDIWYSCLHASEIELVSCKPHVPKPKPLTCYMTEDNGGEPYLCVVDRQGGTEFFSQDSVHNSTVLGRDTIQALTSPVGCQFIIGFGADAGEHVVKVDQYGQVRTAGEIAKASYLYPKFSITNIRSA